METAVLTRALFLPPLPPPMTEFIVSASQPALSALFGREHASNLPSLLLRMIQPSHDPIRNNAHPIGGEVRLWRQDDAFDELLDV